MYTAIMLIICGFLTSYEILDNYFNQPLKNRFLLVGTFSFNVQVYTFKGKEMRIIVWINYSSKLIVFEWIVVCTNC